MYVCPLNRDIDIDIDIDRVAPMLITVKSDRSNFTQVLPEFRFPKNSFRVLPKVFNPYFESLKITF